MEIIGTPLEFAANSTKYELRKAIKTIKEMEYNEFLDRCRVCFEHYLKGDIEQAEWWSRHAELAR